MSQPLYLTLLWHMHQPYYRDTLTGDCLLPWTRLHALKNYYDIPALSAEFPNIRQTFNMVPSLIKQVEEYAHRGDSDIFLDLSRKPAEALSQDDRLFILQHFFQANTDTMITPYPRYRQLLEKRGLYGDLDDLSRANHWFQDQDILDLQVWFNLTWCGHTLQEKPEIKALLEKGSDFTEQEKNRLLDLQREFMKEILPLYRSLQDDGQIEVSISPFYHPILPLLCDTREAAVAMPDADLPNPHFAHPDDARTQIQRSISFYKDRFGRTPNGMWPSEGSVSPAIVPLVSEAGVRWIATDDAILVQSIMKNRRPSDRSHELPAARRYRPYRVEEGGRSVDIVFRDHLLSDHVGFVYSRWKAEDAAHDLVARLLDIRRQIPADESALVPIILDGENAWEYYADHGRAFLRALYRQLSDAAEIQVVTVQEALAAVAPESLDYLFSGSWIEHSYSTWIGHPEKNAGWECLVEARRTLCEREARVTREDAVSIRKARESLYIAEGSDWFWWYGDDHMSDNDEQFDRLFRTHVGNVYRALEEPVPDRLLRPIRRAHVLQPTRRPMGPITPSLDGRATSYYEWLPAGYFDVRGGKGSMHQADTFLKRVHYGFDDAHLYLRIDTATPLAELNGTDTCLRIQFRHPEQRRIMISRDASEHYVLSIDDTQVERTQIAVERVIELSLSFHQLKVMPDDILEFDLCILQDQLEIEHWPPTGPVRLEVPEPDGYDDWLV